MIQNGDKVYIKPPRLREIISVTLNMLIVVFAGTGTYKMLTGAGSGTGLTASGFENFKFFTVLSNELCGVVACLWLTAYIINRKLPVLPKLFAASAAGLTFVIVAAFLAPMYPDLDMYAGGNFWFHLIVPVTGMAEFILYETQERIPFRYAAFSALAAFVYGIFYLGNILVNGIGTWPDTNDWYGFLNWGWGIGLVIFAVTVLLDFGIAVLLRAINNGIYHLSHKGE